jgi:hypothetical protein
MTRLAAGLKPEVTFPIKLVATTADVGKILVLSGRTSLTATDAVTEGEVNAAGGVATTNLDTDTIARGQGVVTTGE